MRSVTLLDTGPLVAAIDRRDQYHGWAIEQFKRLPLPFLTCEAVCTEAAYLLRRIGVKPAALFSLISSGGVVIRYDLEAEAEQLADLLTRYDNIPMDLADACLVRMAEQHANSTVLTLDSDFQIYRKHRREVISVIMP